MKEEFKKKVSKVVKGLGGEIKDTGCLWGITVCGISGLPKGMELFIQPGPNEKMEVSQLIPRDGNETLNLSRPELRPVHIKVSMCRDTGAIVRDIERRLFPTAKVVHGNALKEIQEQQKYRQDRESVKAALMKVGVSFTDPHSESGRFPMQKDGYVNLLQVGRDSVTTLDLRSLSVEKAVKILEILKEDM